MSQQRDAHETTNAKGMEMEKLIEAARKYTNTQVTDAIRMIGGGFIVDQDRRMVRAALIEVYCERFGVEAGDKLMDEIGM